MIHFSMLSNFYLAISISIAQQSLCFFQLVNLRWSLGNITLIVQLCWVVSCQEYFFEDFVDLHDKIGMFIYYSWIHPDIWNCGWSHIPGTIDMQPWSFQHHSLKILSILALPLKYYYISALFEKAWILPNILTIHIGTMRYSYWHWFIPIF